MMYKEYIVPLREEENDSGLMVNAIIRAQPELIRCRECKYDHTCTHEMVRRTEGGGYIYCPVTYCSEGKRKEENE